MVETLRRVSPRLYQSGLITAGVLLCCVGVANWVVGSMKLVEYERVARETMTPTRDPVELSSGFTFTSVSESHERHNIALAKLRYYSVVLTVGQLLLFAGLVLIVVGYVRLSGAARAPSQNKTLLDSL